ncbi:MAG: queuosine precursor transporter [Simkania sp.]|nr:queuosine precursor transporter [Simkania sp.]
MLNEFLFFFHLLLIVAFTIGALRLGKEALITWIALQAVLANLFVLKQIPLFSLQVTCCDIFILGVVLGLNLLQEYFGALYAKRAIFLSFASMLAFAVLSKIHLTYLPSMSDWSQGAYNTILSHSPRILLASLASFFIVQQFDVRFYGWLRRYFHGKYLSRRTTISLIVSQAIDTLLFTFLGLSGVIDHLVSIMVMSFFVKVIIAVCAASCTALFKKFLPVRSEEVA